MMSVPQRAAAMAIRLTSVRADLLQRVASLGLAAVLSGSAIFAIGAATVTTNALHDVSAANALNDLYGQARYFVGAEESLERKYRLEPGVAVRAVHRRVEEALERAIRTAGRSGNSADRLATPAILAAHARYVVATRAMFAAVDAHRSALALRIDQTQVDPVFAVVERAVSVRARRQRDDTQAIVARLTDVQRSIIEYTIGLAFFSFIVLIAHFGVLRTFQRRLKAAYDAEIKVLEEATLIDHLTGIGNHRAYQEDFDREAARAVRHGETLSLALIDIDEMKLVNDQHGHLHGDRILAAFGSMLKHLRSEHRTFRLGGDEFGLLLPNTSEHDATVLLNRLREDVEEELPGVTISVGVASLQGSIGVIETLQGQADAALFAAKRAGRNSVVAFNVKNDGVWLLSPTKIKSLRKLIAEDGVRMAFQPIWDVDGCTILAYEALARPAVDYGFPGPQDMFDLAERIGRAHEVDAVCRRVTLECARRLPHDVLLFMNMSPQTLDHDRLDVAQFTADVLATGLTPHRIVIEITERSIAPIDVVIGAAKELQHAGFRLALDDTGAGNAGLEMLSRLPVDFVKIDRAIIVQAMTERSARGVIAGIIAIARETGAYVIAEGIEDVGMLDLVCGGFGTADGQYGVKGVQGYLLHRPSEDFVAPAAASAVTDLLRGAWFHRAMTSASPGARLPTAD